MIHVAPLLRSRFRVPARRCAPGPHGFVCLPRARRGVDPDHECPSFGRREPAGVHDARAVRAQRAVRLNVDANGDAVADTAYRVRFSPSADGSQTATVRRVEGAQAAETGDSGSVMIEAAPASTGRRRASDGGRPLPLLRGLPAIPSSTRGERRMICSSPATISSSTRTCAASCWKCPTPPLDPIASAYGRARWSARAGLL
jgi:hypothetical protein